MKRILTFCLILLAWPALGQRVMMTADVDLYVNCATGSDGNLGTAAQPFATPARAYYYDQAHFDHGGPFVTRANLQSNCTGVTTSLWGPLVGAQGSTSFVFQGPVGCRSCVIVSGVAISLFQAWGGAQYTVQWMWLKSPGGAGVVVGDGMVNVGNVYWDAAATHLDAAGPRAQINTFGYDIILSTSIGNFHAVAEDHSLITMNQSIGISACPVFGIAYVGADLGGMIDATGFTWSHAGCPQGPAYTASSGGIIFSGGAGLTNFFPASAPGYADPGTFGHAE